MSSSYAGEQLSKELFLGILKLADKAIISSEQLIRRLAGYDKKTIQTKIKYARDKGYITPVARGSYRITSKGTSKLNQLSFTKIEKDSWDGCWRMITYDIPEQQKHKRDAVRRLIKQLGMVQLQKSIWVLPYNCKRQFEELDKAYGAELHILYIEVTDFSSSEEYLKYWGLDSFLRVRAKKSQVVSSTNNTGL